MYFSVLKFSWKWGQDQHYRKKLILTRETTQNSWNGFTLPPVEAFLFPEIYKLGGALKFTTLLLILLPGMEATRGRQDHATRRPHHEPANRRRDRRKTDPRHRLPLRANVSREATQHVQRRRHAARGHGLGNFRAHSSAGGAGSLGESVRWCPPLHCVKLYNQRSCLQHQFLRTLS